MANTGGMAPTGCYKCQRPGHWARDCPSNPNTTTDDNTNTNTNTNTSNSTPKPPPYQPYKPSTDSGLNVKKKEPKVKAPRRSLPKLTPEILLSNAGLGHILTYFPRALKCRGRGHEVDDLQHLLGMYAEWHSLLLPYYNFNQFIEKVEQVGSTKRVKVSIRGLRERISNGEDPTKLHEKQDKEPTSFEQDAQGGVDMSSHSQNNTVQNEGASDAHEDIPQDIWEDAAGATDVHDDMFQEIWEAETKDSFQPSPVKSVPSDDTSVGKEVPHQIPNKSTGTGTLNQLSEEQKARMEANRLKALERAAARRSSKILND